MNLKILRQQARFKSSVTNSAVISTADLNQQINVAYDIMAREISSVDEDFYEEQKTKFNLGLNSGMYSLPLDCMRVKQIRLAYTTPTDESDYVIANFYDPSQVESVSVDEENVSASYPIVDVTNNYFRIWPVPTSAVTNGGEIYYIATPSALANSGDSPVLPTQYHDLLAVYAGRELAGRLEYWNKWKAMNDQWLNGIETMKKRLANREMNKTIRFKNISEVGNNNNVRELFDN